MNDFYIKKVDVFVAGALMALAWSWLPWSVYNLFALVTNRLPTIEMFGYFIVTLICAGVFTAYFEDHQKGDAWTN